VNIKALLERSGGTVEAQSAARLNSLSERLYAALIAPFQDRLNARQRLLIVPDKSLAYLPFETLLSRKTVGSSRTEYLVERFAITYAPSASALAEVREMRSRPQTQALRGFC
jgi:CHAT domain-containing protein